MNSRFSYGGRENHMFDFIKEGKFTTPSAYAKEFGISKEAASVTFRRLLLKGRVRKLVVVTEEKE